MSTASSVRSGDSARSYPTLFASGSKSGSSHSSLRASARVSTAAGVALPKAPLAAPATPLVQRYFICNITINGKEQALYVNPVGHDGKDIPMPEGWHFPTERLAVCKGIFQSMITNGDNDTDIKATYPELKSVTIHGFTTATGKIENHTITTQNLFLNFQYTLLTGATNRPPTVTATLTATTPKPKRRNRRIPELQGSETKKPVFQSGGLTNRSSRRSSDSFGWGSR
jgi:hypothetical protein